MKAEIVSILDLKKTVADHKAEELLAELPNDKVIRVILESQETPRQLGRIFRKAAATVGREITIRTNKDRQLIIRLKQAKG